MTHVFLWNRLLKWLWVLSHQRIVLEGNRLGTVEMLMLLI